MDSERARQLLAAERTRVEEALAGLERSEADKDEPGDGGSENLYQAEFDAGRAEDLAKELGHRDYKTTLIYADYAPDPSRGARWAEAAFGNTRTH